MVRQTWSMLLGKEADFEIVDECHNGLEVIEAAQRLDPDVILMDINMAPVNGFEATRKILKSRPQIKIIGMSVNNQPTYARNLLQLGAKGFITKNSNAIEMIKGIKEVCQGHIFICEEVQRKMNSGV